MQTFTFTKAGYSCQVFMFGQSACPCVYCITETDDAHQLADALAGQNIILVTISGVQWEADLSPWPAPKAFRGSRDFTGGADRFIHIIEQEIMPEAESHFGIVPTYRIAAGYSLAGLFSLYTLYKTQIFHRIVCASGSLWYDKFLDFMRHNQVELLPEKVYFSLGDKEKYTKNKRLAVVEERTVEAQELLGSQGVETVFVKNAGGHFQEPVERLAKGIRWGVLSLKKESYKYIASCVFTRDYPELSKRTIAYIESLNIPIMRCCVDKYKVREFEDSVDSSVHDQWKELPHHLPIESTDTIISVCHNCTNIIAEKFPGLKIISLYELILNDENFQFPDYHNEEMTIQDCWRAADHFEEKKAVRLLLEKMNIRVREIKEPENFCGISLYRPQPARNPVMAPKHYGPQNTLGKFGTYSAEEQAAFMVKHAEKIETDKVVSYCHYCQKGLELSGKEPHHIVELLFPE